MNEPAPLGHAGPVRVTAAAFASSAAGCWRSGPISGPLDFAERHRAEALVGVYWIADEHGRLVYLGQARRNGGVSARLDEHANDLTKRDVFDRVWWVPLHDQTPAQVVNAVEGKLADLLGVRGKLRGHAGLRIWPPSALWATLVCSQEARAAAGAAAL